MPDPPSKGGASAARDALNELDRDSSAINGAVLGAARSSEWSTLGAPTLDLPCQRIYAVLNGAPVMEIINGWHVRPLSGEGRRAAMVDAKLRSTSDAIAGPSGRRAFMELLSDTLETGRFYQNLGTGLRAPGLVTMRPPGSELSKATTQLSTNPGLAGATLSAAALLVLFGMSAVRLGTWVVDRGRR